ncbi:MAG: hemolysin family protein [Bacteroidota bacterium]
MIALIVFFSISIIFSFLCSIWEAVLLSITPAHVEIKLKEGSQVGKQLKAFKDNIDQPLAAILTLNTIAHTAGAIGVGSAATKIWGEENELITGFLVPVLMTMAILILSELIPKTLGANNWKKWTNFTVTALRWVIFLLWPLVWLGQWVTKALKKEKNKSVLSRADFSAMAEIGQKEGIFEEGESKIIKNLLHFDTILVKNIMTPRTVAITAPSDQSIQAFFDKYPDLRFSRIPVYQENKDQINHFFLKDELLTKLIKGEGEDQLKSISREIMIINEQMPLPDLFSRFTEKREHIALVVDEFGGTSGIVTMEDVLETLLGLEIVDELDSIEDMQLLARQNWEKRAKRLGLIETSNPSKQTNTSNSK